MQTFINIHPRDITATDNFIIHLSRNFDREKTEKGRNHVILCFKLPMDIFVGCSSAFIS